MIALIDAYRKELSDIAEFSDHTVETYLSGVIRYCDYAKNTLKINPITSKGIHLLQWLAEVRKAGISNSRMQHHHSALKTFFGLLVKLKVTKKNPADALPQIWKTKSDRNQPVSKRTAYRLLHSIDQSTWYGKRDFLIIAMLWALGLRVSELTSLRVKNVEPDHDPGNKIGLLRVRGKNKIHRALFVVDKLYEAMNDYLNHPQSPKKKNDPLFPIQAGTPIPNNRVLKLIKEYAQAAGIKARITPHVLRHCFATEMYHQGVPLQAVQAMMGHSKKGETSVYIHVSDQLQKQALEHLCLEGGPLWG